MASMRTCWVTSVPRPSSKRARLSRSLTSAVMRVLEASMRLIVESARSSALDSWRCMR